jgi:hypothetical protein
MGASGESGVGLRGWGGKGRFHGFEQEVQEDLVDLLNPFGMLDGNDDFGVGEAGEGSAVAPQQRQHAQAARPGLLEGAGQVRRRAAGGKEDEEVSLAAQSLHLPREDLVVAEIVGDAGQRGAVGRQGDARERTAVRPVPAAQLLGHVHGLGRAAAVAGGQHLAALLQCPYEELRRVGDRGQEAGQSPDGDAGFLDVGGEQGFQVFSVWVHRGSSLPRRPLPCRMATRTERIREAAVTLAFPAELQ